MFELEQIYAIIIAALPALTSIIGIVLAVVKSIKKSETTSTDVINKFEEVRMEIFNTKEYSELKNQLSIAHQENYELKKKLNELLTKIDHIQRKEEE
jgi:predicted  nucleic acid-binding Zn-ribbon protein